MEKHPQIKELFQLYNSETEAFRKVHRLIDLFESIVKSHTIVIMGEYFSRMEVSDAVKGLLPDGLRTPSLGTWQLFSRVLFQELKEKQHPFLLPDFENEFEWLDKAILQEKTNIINFRNTYAHGATPSDEKCKQDIKQFEPFLQKLLQLKWLSESAFIINKNKVYLERLMDTKTLSVHPIMVSRKENDLEQLVFFNDLKNNKAGLLNYTLSKHYTEKEFVNEFQQYIPLNEWKKRGNQQFKQSVEELTETFKGRVEELTKIKEFVNKNTKGFLCITGNPGIGKSSLIAQAFKEINSEETKDQYYLIEYFIKRGSAQARPDFLLNYLQKALSGGMKKVISPVGTGMVEKGDAINENLKIWNEENPNRKLILLMDGLDEGIEEGLLDFMPRQLFEGVLIIYGSRPGGHEKLSNFWMELPAEKKKFLELKGLNSNDIRALLYEVTDKYALQQQWIDTIAKRSEGNPLYLKLLCESIEVGETDINDENSLPSDIGRYYENFLLRYSKMADGDNLLQTLYVIAAAHDYLSEHHIELILGIGEATSARVMSILSEVLYDNPFTEDIADWQLFHESFREYLKANRTSKIQDAEQKIIKFCSEWEKLNGKWEQKYSMMHYAKHLTNAIEKEILLPDELYRLADDNAYKKQQIKATNIYSHTFDLIRSARNLACNKSDCSTAIHFAIERLKEAVKETQTIHEMIQLIRDGDVDTAILRTEGWRESNKLINYLLFLQELTFGESKSKDFQKSAIIKVLSAIEDMPIYNDMFRWDSFIPAIAIYRFDIELRKLGLNANILWLRAKNDFRDFEDLISYDEVYTENASLEIWAIIFNNFHDFDAERCASSLAFELIKRDSELSFQKKISNLAKNTFILNAIEEEKSKNDARLSSNDEENKTIGLVLTPEIKILMEYFNNADNILQKQHHLESVFKSINLINDIQYKFRACIAVITELGNKGCKNECLSLIDLSILCAEKFEKNPDDENQFDSFQSSLIKVLKLCAAFEITTHFDIILLKLDDSDNFLEKASAFYIISCYQLTKGKSEIAYSLLIAAKKCVKDYHVLVGHHIHFFTGCEGGFESCSNAYETIAFALFEINKLEDAVETARLNINIDPVMKKMFAACVRNNNWNTYIELHYKIIYFKSKILDTFGRHSQGWWERSNYKDSTLSLLETGKKEKALLQLRKLIVEYEHKGFDAFFKESWIIEVIIGSKDIKLALDFVEILNLTSYEDHDSILKILSAFLSAENTELVQRKYDEELEKCYSSENNYGIISASESLRKSGRKEDSLKLLNKAIELNNDAEEKLNIYNALIAHEKFVDAEKLIVNNVDLADKLKQISKAPYPDKYKLTEDQVKSEQWIFNEESSIGVEEKIKLIEELCAKACKMFLEGKRDIAEKYLKYAESLIPEDSSLKTIGMAYLEIEIFERGKAVITTIASPTVRELALINSIHFFNKMGDVTSITLCYNELFELYRPDILIESILIDSDHILANFDILQLVSEVQIKKLEEIKILFTKESSVEIEVLICFIYFAKNYTANTANALKKMTETINFFKDYGERNDAISVVSEFLYTVKTDANLAYNWMKCFSNPEECNLCLSSILEATDFEKADEKFLLEYLPFANNKNAWNLLFKHAAWQCSYSEKPDRKILAEIESVLDIAHYTCFLEDEKIKSSQNISEWINEITDEDDREDILSWAEKVKSGIMNEEKFMERVGRKWQSGLLRQS